MEAEDVCSKTESCGPAIVDSSPASLDSGLKIYKYINFGIKVKICHEVYTSK